MAVESISKWKQVYLDLLKGQDKQEFMDRDVGCFWDILPDDFSGRYTEQGKWRKEQALIKLKKLLRIN